MLDFNLYFKLGTDHILTWEAMDHILFVAALCIRYTLKDWRKVAVLVTAFTIGHSITLALSTFGAISMNTKWIEFLIPLTISATTINNLLQRSGTGNKKLPLVYFFALFFGMIHGMAYATTLLSLEGSKDLSAHLLAFNIGIEVAQLIVVAIVLTLSELAVRFLKVPPLRWLQLISLLILTISVQMALERLPELLYLKA